MMPKSLAHNHPTWDFWRGRDPGCDSATAATAATAQAVLSIFNLVRREYLVNPADTLDKSMLEKKGESGCKLSRLSLGLFAQCLG
jgi:hypothetical protein